MNEDENQENVEKPVVCARCHSLRLYEKVKDPSVENLLPNFDFAHAVGLNIGLERGQERVGRLKLTSVLMILTRLTREEQKLVHISKELKPRTYRIKVHSSPPDSLSNETALEEPAFSSLVCIIHFEISQFHYLLVGSSGWMWNYLLFCVCYNLDISTDSTSYGEDRERQHNAGRTFRVSAAGTIFFRNWMLCCWCKFSLVAEKKKKLLMTEDGNLLSLNLVCGISLSLTLALLLS
ncbi:hypothetical protein CQW23_01312 [Capsicum baccatum]|uniref:Uncharacterized protein n=1 Tax=Capsicum baccatum TaxID=33114 RepID=A0A2G2XNC1_CAPBA|nr:hypothetical protein CQW23_01312 [Capsicum baccatum]